MNGRVKLAILLFLLGGYTSVSFIVDSWEGRLCWDSSGTYVRLPYMTALRGAIDALGARMSSLSSFSTLLELLVLTAFVWPIAALLILNRGSIVLGAALLTLLPFALNVRDQIAFGIQQYCTNDGMAELGFGVLQFLVISITILMLLAMPLADRIAVRVAATRATRHPERSRRGWR
jgi:hypothetical protein